MKVTKQQILAWLDLVSTIISDNKDYLTELDSAIGDADHGINMNRGFKKVKEELPELAQSDIGSILKTTGMTLMSSIGGASGPLYGTFFMRSGMALAAKEELDCTAVLTLIKSGAEGIAQRGRPNRGDKTMYDVWAPAVECFEKTLRENGNDLMASLESSVKAAETAKTATIDMLAKKGRASYLGERSIGHQDPGATSSFLILNALLDTLKA
jgi:phosphoenolpyruvate---glycerone phosphotransferase subunit DhaL